MSLRKKVFLYILVTIVFLILLMSLTSNFLAMKAFEGVERRFFEQDMARVRSRLHQCKRNRLPRKRLQFLMILTTAYRSEEYPMIEELQRTAQWMAARKGRITGSSAGAALGLCPWRSPDDVIRAMVREYHGAESDFKGNPASSIFDSMSTMVLGDTMIKVLSWYDNEWGYSSRLADLTSYIIDKGL